MAVHSNPFCQWALAQADQTIADFRRHPVISAPLSPATPANWEDGQDCIIVTSVKDADVPGLFPKGSRTVKPYLRFTPQPNR